ncbi:MAG: hypothetical protein ACI4B3_08425, partial [Prevotella sp.]
MMYRIWGVAVWGMIAVAWILSSCSTDETSRRELRVYLFPYIPDPATYYNELEADFERIHRDIDLVILTDSNYYRGGLLTADADVMEVDCIFLKEMVEKKRVRPYPNQGGLDKTDTLDFAGAHSLNGTLYGIPHWICSNCLFYNKNDNELSATDDMMQIANVLKGRGTKLSVYIDDICAGELYAHALSEKYEGYEEQRRYMSTDNLDMEIVNDIRTIMSLDDGHNGEVVPFVCGLSDVVIGYSEYLHFILETIHDNEKAILRSEDVAMKSVSFYGSKRKKLAWLDILAISSNVDEQKCNDAMAFINYLISDEAYKLALLPKSNGYSQYLLPTYTHLFTDTEIMSSVPSYQSHAEFASNL